MLLTEQLPLAETPGMVADCKGKNKQNAKQLEMLRQAKISSVETTIALFRSTYECEPGVPHFARQSIPRGASSSSS